MSFFFVRVETDAGVVGFGEACDSYGCSYASVVKTIVDDVFAPSSLGKQCPQSNRWPIGCDCSLAAGLATNGS